MCLWTSSSTRPKGHHRLHLAPVPTLEDSVRKEGQEPADGGAAAEYAARYNAISSAIRRGDMTAAPTYDVTIKSCSITLGHSADNARSWSTATLNVSINRLKILAYIATASLSANASISQAGQAEQVFCHYFPALGTWIEYKLYSLLSFCESMREVATGAKDAQLRIIKAPMPCRVLSILNKNGEEVKPGEGVMAMESMKMEINISVTVGGKFETFLNKGDAVDEGKVLCSVV